MVTDLVRYLVVGGMCVLVVGLLLFAQSLAPKYESMFAQSEWVQSPSLRLDFMRGHTFMDFFSREIFGNYLNSTLDSMRASGAGWVVYDNYWTYYSLEPPQIASFGTKPDNQFRDATEAEIAVMIEGAHTRGMRFALMIELNWDGMMGEWRDWEYAQALWGDSVEFLADKCSDLRAWPVSPEAIDYWDQWFAAYEVVAFHHARIAEIHSADMLVIGKQIAGAVCAGNEERWRKLIAEIRKIYNGPIGYAALAIPGLSEPNEFPCDALDYLIIYHYYQISSEADPTITDLREAFEYYNDSEFEPLSRQHDVPIIFLTPFQSRDHGAWQQWFEPGAPAPDVGEDLLIQAKMYEAFLQSIADEEWVAGLWTWGYWWRDDFDTTYNPGDSSFNKSSTVRNKPAAHILAKWWNADSLTLSGADSMTSHPLAPLDSCDDAVSLLSINLSVITWVASINEDDNPNPIDNYAEIIEGADEHGSYYGMEWNSPAPTDFTLNLPKYLALDGAKMFSLTLWASEPMNIDVWIACEGDYCGREWRNAALDQSLSIEAGTGQYVLPYEVFTEDPIDNCADPLSEDALEHIYWINLFPSAGAGELKVYDISACEGARSSP